MGTIKTTNIEPIADNGTVTLGSSGDTFTIPSGVTMVNNGTQTGFGGANTPAFLANLSSDFTLTDESAVKVQFNNEIFDIGSCYDPSSNFRFTVPSGEGGKYFVYAQLVINASGSSVYRSDVKIYKNGSEFTSSVGFASNNTQYSVWCSWSGAIVLNASDYLEVYNYNDVSSGTPVARSSSMQSIFGAYKIIE
tara:strand:+ start:518 stop:1096 length:579 start_codon:yes stop_codon:yes gene_type:complete